MDNHRRNQQRWPDGGRVLGLQRKFARVLGKTGMIGKIRSQRITLTANESYAITSCPFVEGGLFISGVSDRCWKQGVRVEKLDVAKRISALTAVQLAVS